MRSILKYSDQLPTQLANIALSTPLNPRFSGVNPQNGNFPHRANKTPLPRYTGVTNTASTPKTAPNLPTPHNPTKEKAHRRERESIARSAERGITVPPVLSYMPRYAFNA